MKKNSCVSVIIPTYNRAKLVCEAIESVLNQTYRGFEIIVVDDGSTDATEQVLLPFSDRIRYVKQERMGPGAARNRGLVEARGKYIAFLDSDDLWRDFKLELQVALMERLPEIGFLSSEFSIRKNSGKEIHSALRTWHKELRPWKNVYQKSISYSSLGLPLALPNGDFTIYLGNLYLQLLQDPYILPSSAIVRRDCLTEDTKFPEGVYLYEDWEFFARLSRTLEAAFLDLETTINRGHKDEVRLTQCSPMKAAENRLGLMERVWKSDQLFKEQYGEEIRRVEGEQLLILVKNLLLESQPKNARKILRQWCELGLSEGRYRALVLKFFAYLPWGDKILVFVRNLRRMFAIRKSA